MLLISIEIVFRILFELEVTLNFGGLTILGRAPPSSFRFCLTASMAPAGFCSDDFSDILVTLSSFPEVKV